jgi:hypothetical protein
MERSPAEVPRSPRGLFVDSDVRRSSDMSTSGTDLPYRRSHLINDVWGARPEVTSPSHNSPPLSPSGAVSGRVSAVSLRSMLDRVALLQNQCEEEEIDEGLIIFLIWLSIDIGKTPLLLGHDHGPVRPRLVLSHLWRVYRL